MRLSTDERETIDRIVHTHVPNGRIYLFGSRADDAQKGGDIDLLILSTEPVGFHTQSAVYWALQEALGEQKIDIVYQQYGHLSTFGQLVLEKAVEI